MPFFDLKPFISKTRTQGLNLNTIYELKAVISYINFGNNGKYFADCKVKINNNSMWIRYIDSYYQIIQPNDVCIYEPQILIYEIYNPQQTMGMNMNNPMNMGTSNLGNNNEYISFNNMNVKQAHMMYNNNNMGMINNQNMMMNNIGPMVMNQNPMMMNNPNTMMNNNNNINMNNFQMQGSNANSMQNLFDNIKTFKNYNQVQPSDFNNMTLKVSENNIKFPQNNFINVQQQQMNNNQFLQQVNQFNNNMNSSNMKINLDLSTIPEEVSIEDAQMQNQNMMKRFALDYLVGEQILNNEFH